MNIVNAGARYQVYGEDVQTYKSLPAATYTIGFHPMQGFWLTKHSDLDVKEDSIYGKHDYCAEKVMSGYRESNRNFGVILSGKKGIGKSLMARIIADKAIASGMPVIIVDKAIGGIADFLSSIEQEVVIIFDEFEKTFARKDGEDPQVELLSLFDGIDSGKKLFIITCNDPRQLNEFLVNRPGRFHYHFEIVCPTGDEVRAYMQDKLGDGFDDEIKKVIKLSSIADITYDCLRAIAFELKQGYGIEETLEDLNINYERGMSFDITVRLNNGWTLTSYSNTIDLYSRREARISFYHDKDRFYMEFAPSDVAMVNGILTLKEGSGTFFSDYDYLDDKFPNDEEACKARREFNRNIKVESAALTKVATTYMNKYVDV